MPRAEKVNRKVVDSQGVSSAYGHQNTYGMTPKLDEGLQHFQGISEISTQMNAL